MLLENTVSYVIKTPAFYELISKDLRASHVLNGKALDQSPAGKRNTAMVLQGTLSCVPDHPLEDKEQALITGLKI